MATVYLQLKRMPRSGSFILGIKWKSQGLSPCWYTMLVTTLKDSKTSKQPSYLLFWDVTRRRFAISYRLCGQPIGPTTRVKQDFPSCPETSVTNYQPTLCNIPEEQKSYLDRGGSLKPCTLQALLTGVSQCTC